MGRSDYHHPRPTDPAELAISTDCASESAQRNFYRGSWFDALEVYWRDISGGGRLKDRAYDSPAVHRITGSSAVAEHSTLARRPSFQGTPAVWLRSAKTPSTLQ
jgi:non-lysosomal glucosylceramidase